MPVIEAAPPADGLYRLGWNPNPVALPPRDRAGKSRFDDPAGQYQVLYAAEQPRGCFVETLAQFRLSVKTLAGMRRVEGADRLGLPHRGVIFRDWIENHSIGRFILAPQQRWLDMRHLETREVIRAQLATQLLELGYSDFDVSDATARDRRVTQLVSRWAFENGYHGIAYLSRMDHRQMCWAVFERATFSVVSIEPVRDDDTDLLAAAAMFDLLLKGSPERREPGRL